MSEILNDRYRLDKLLGEGGMAIVYQGSDLMLERTIAVKILKETFSSSLPQEMRKDAEKASRQINTAKVQFSESSVRALFSDFIFFLPRLHGFLIPS